MRKFILILIVFIISSCSYYGVVDSTGKKETNIQNIVQQEEEKNIVENQVEQGNNDNIETLQEDKILETKGNSTELQEKPKAVSRKIETQTEKSTNNDKKNEKAKETQIAEKKQEKNKESKAENIALPKEEQKPKNETKIEEVKEKVHNCSKDGHLVDVGNTGKWFKTKAEAIEYFDKEQEICEQKWLDGGSYDDYLAKCPFGYDFWTCPNCKYYTINFYK